jgi:DHA1 family inner membrane transport protein
LFVLSPLTQTLELPILPIDPAEELNEAETDRDALAEAFGVDSIDESGYDTHPTTMSIPMPGGVETLVIDEGVGAERSLESILISPRRAKLALAALATGAFAMGANEASVVALSPQIAAGLGVPVATIGLLVTAFALTVVVLTLPLTMLTSRFSKRFTLTSTLGVWTVGVLVAATAGSVAHLATGRIVSAAAHALFWAIVAPTAASLFAPHLRGRTVTRIMVGAAAAGVVGTPLVTVAGKSIDWHAPFWGFVGLGIILTVALSLTLPARRPVIDSDAPVTTPTLVRGDLPSKPAFIRVLAVTFLASASMGATWTYIVPFYRGEASITSNSVPVMFALGGVLAVAATLMVSPFLVRRVVRTVAAGLLALMFGWVLLALAQPWSAISAQVVLSIGWAISLAAMLNWAMRHSPWRTEIGAGTYTMTMNAGAAAGPLLGAGVVALWGLAWLPVVSLALIIAAGIVTAGADKTMRRRLHVPRRLRMARIEREALRERRREWTRRSELEFKRPKWRARSLPKDVAKASKGAVKAGKHAATASKNAGKDAAKDAAKASKHAATVSKVAVKAASDKTKRATKRATEGTPLDPHRKPRE